MCLKLGENVLFDRKKHDQFWSSFLFLPFPFVCPKWLKYTAFAFQKPKQGRQKTRPPQLEYYRCSLVLFKAQPTLGPRASIKCQLGPLSAGFDLFFLKIFLFFLKCRFGCLSAEFSKKVERKVEKISLRTKKDEKKKI